MTFVGKYSLDSLQGEGRWIRVAVWPSADYTPAVARNMRTSLEKIARVQDQLMGGPPYEQYTVFFNVIHEPIDFGGGLQHLAPPYDIMPAGAFADEAGEFSDLTPPPLFHQGLSQRETTQ